MIYDEICWQVLEENIVKILMSLININATFIFFCRDSNHKCESSFTSTLEMSREDVIFGSKVGNTTNPQFLEVDNWVKYLFLHLLTIPMFL